VLSCTLSQLHVQQDPVIGSPEESDAMSAPEQQDLPEFTIALGLSGNKTVIPTGLIRFHHLPLELE
jgi:hypothetical protein